MKRMYVQPQTGEIFVEMCGTLCGSVNVTFGAGKGNGPALAPMQMNSFYQSK